MMRKILLAALAAFAIILSACEELAGALGLHSDQEVMAVSLSSSVESLSLVVGESDTITVSIEGNASLGEVFWEWDSDIAQVTARGGIAIVHALQAGNGILTAAHHRAVSALSIAISVQESSHDLSSDPGEAGEGIYLSTQTQALSTEVGEVIPLRVDLVNASVLEEQRIGWSVDDSQDRKSVV